MRKCGPCAATEAVGHMHKHIVQMEFSADLP